MAKELDVYREWLGIAETARPLNCYQLLRLNTFEDNATKIRAHHRKMNAHVRKFASGDYARQSQELLNELAKAMLCLTDAQRKREYDASLGREDTGEGRRRTLEEVLLAGKVIDQDQLTKARNYAEAVGLDIREALLQQKMAAPEVVMLAYAESQGLPYVELDDVGVDEALVPQVPGHIARQHSCVPVMVDQDQLLIASPNPLIPDVEEELRLRFNMPVRTVLCTAASVNAKVAECYPREAGESDLPATKKKSGKKKRTREPREQIYLTKEEKIRRAGMFTLIAFNATIILLMSLFTILRGGMGLLNFLDFAVAIFLALLAGGAALGISMKVLR